MAINKGIVGIGESSTPVVPNENFNPLLYTGNSTDDFETALTQSVTGVGFQPDLVWIKSRNQAYSNMIFDSVRGATNVISSNIDAAQSSSAGFLKSFDSDGFGLGGDFSVNRGSYPFISWNWKAGGAPTATNSAGAGNVPTSGSVMIDGVASTAALAGSIAATKISANTAAGFSIVNYGGSTSGATVGHGLNSTPEVIIIKCTSNGSTNWISYHQPLGDDYYLTLNSNIAKTSSSNWLQPNSTTFALNQTFGNANTSGRDYIAYCFHSVDGYSKIGSYIGTGAAGNSIVTGFRPAFVMFKRSSAAGSGGNWTIKDNKRDTVNPNTENLYANLSALEENAYPVNFLSNGFEILETDVDINGSGEDYIFMAFAE